MISTENRHAIMYASALGQPLRASLNELAALFCLFTRRNVERLMDTLQRAAMIQHDKLYQRLFGLTDMGPLPHFD